MLNVDYKFDEIVIGSTLPALLYSYFYNIPFVSCGVEPPDSFQRFPPDYDLNKFGFDNLSEEWNTPHGKKFVGMQKYLLWQRLFTILGYAGLKLTCDATFIRKEDENTLAVFIKGKSVTYKSDKQYFFTDKDIRGLSMIKPSNFNRVIDWFDVKSGMSHPYDSISPRSLKKFEDKFKNFDSFLKEIIFYKSNRIRAGLNFKDAVAISVLGQHSLEKYEYSDTEAWLALKIIFEEVGIKGTGNGKDKKGDKRYLPINLSHTKREVQPVLSLYKETEFHGKLMKNDYIPLENNIIETHMVKPSYASQLLTYFTAITI